MVKSVDWSGILKRRIFQAGNNSLEGLKACFEHEEAFRVEVFLGAIFLVIATCISDSMAEWAILVAAMVQVLIVELLNSAVEATVDRIGEEYHDLAKRAKDIGSAAVLLSMMLFLVVWGAVICSKLYHL